MTTTHDYANAESLSLDSVRQACMKEGLEDFFTPDEGAGQMLFAYLGALIKWNRVMNLVGPSHWQDVLRTLIADSVYLAQFLETHVTEENPECWDLGAGAGLPGIPLRMLWQKGQYTLVEVREKRALFLKTVLATCSLGETHSFLGRAETFMPQRPLADLIVSRAFLPWEKVLSLVGTYMKPGGLAVFLTLQPAPALEEPVGGVEWEVVGEKQYTVVSDTRYFWAIRKKS